MLTGTCQKAVGVGMTVVSKSNPWSVQDSLAGRLTLGF